MLEEMDAGKVIFPGRNIGFFMLVELLEIYEFLRLNS
jgi:hypothetical protein